MSGKRQMSSPDSEEERDRRKARREAMDKETEWMSKGEKRLWEFIEKKMMKLRNEMADENMDTWILEEKEWERKLEEKNQKIEELDKRVKELKEINKEGRMKEVGNEMINVDEQENEETWSLVVKNKKKIKEQVVDALEDRTVQRKLVKVTEEAKDKKAKEKNIVVHGWLEVKSKGLNREDMKDSKRVGKVIIGEFLESKVEAESTEWYGGDEEKVLVLKMKTREDKSELMEKRVQLKGTTVYLDDDLTKDERKIQKEMLRIRKELKTKNELSKVWVGHRKMFIDGKWIDCEQLKEQDFVKGYGVKRNMEREEVAVIEERQRVDDKEGNEGKTGRERGVEKEVERKQTDGQENKESTSGPRISFSEYNKTHK